MTAVWMWFRVEWRTRWRALIGLLLLIAFATAAVAATTAGARRGTTAMDRLVAESDPATVMVLLNRGAYDWDVVRAMPQVESVAAFAVSGFAVEGVTDDPDVDPSSLGFFPFIDDQVWAALERPVLLDGRLPDPIRSDEVVVSSSFVDSFDKRVGDAVTLHLYSADQLNSYDDGWPSGPTVDATIVGVIRSAWFHDQPDTPLGAVFASPGLYLQYPDNVIGTTDAVSVNALVRLRDGEAGLDEFEREFTQITGIDNAEFGNLHDEARRTRDVTAFEARVLQLVSLVALVASLVLLGVAISRYCATSFANLGVLQAFGLSPGQMRLAISAGPVSAAVVGTILGTTAAWWASRWFPIGSAALVEPSLGTSFDRLTLLSPLIIVPLLVAATCLMALRSAQQSNRSTSRLSVVETATAAWPVTLGIGTRFALSGRSTRNSASSVPALVGATLGIAGVTAALTFASGITDATDGYQRFGQKYELFTFFGLGGDDLVDAEEALATIAADPAVDGVLDARNDVANSASGSVSLFDYRPVGAPVDVVVTKGRLPTATSDIALAPLSASQADVDVGGTISLSGPSGTRTLTVTGIAYVPIGPHNSYSTGGWVLPDTFDELFDGFRFHFGFVSTPPEADPQAVVDRLGRRDIELAQGPIFPPKERAELNELRTMPLYLAGFLAILAVGAVAHTLASTARRRRHDVAMLRALGMRPRDTAAIVFVQAIAIGAVGLAIGLPLGLAVGRSVWRTVANDTPVEFIVPDSWSTMAVTAAVALAAVSTLAVWPSLRLAHLKLARELRTE
ncbi:MAG TPA: FtsX-like permease family protein [Ilumatobacteraceae bacterium]|nr:FtsX-like permease family protein [Ilumatobacteraceae bacterium]